jgi:hypothetical protein
LAEVLTSTVLEVLDEFIGSEGVDELGRCPHVTDNDRNRQLDGLTVGELS